MAGLIPEPYVRFAERTFAAFSQRSAVTAERDVAEGVWRAAKEPATMQDSA